MSQVIVDDDKTGMLLLTKGKLQRRVTLIALNKVEPRTLPSAKVAEAKRLVGAKRATLAVELLEFAPQVAAAMQYVFGETLVRAATWTRRHARPHRPHPSPLHPGPHPSRPSASQSSSVPLSPTTPCTIRCARIRRRRASCASSLSSRR